MSNTAAEDSRPALSCRGELGVFDQLDPTLDVLHDRPAALRGGCEERDPAWSPLASAVCYAQPDESGVLLRHRPCLCQPCAPKRMNQRPQKSH
jgi:hypothetical protein